MPEPSGQRVRWEPGSSWGEIAVVTALLLIVLAVPYGNVVFLGRSLVYSDNSSPLDPHFRGKYGPRLVSPNVWRSQNLLLTANFHDPGAAKMQWEPAGEFLRTGLAKGEWPWWDPYVGAGAPAMANMTPTFFFPPYFLTVALGNTSLLKNLYSIFLFLTSGLCTYLFLRRHGIGRPACFFGATVYMLSGAMAQHVGSVFGQTAACLPLVLWATRRLLDSPRPVRVAELAVAYAATALSSFPPMLLPLFAFAAFYWLWMAATAERPARAKLGQGWHFALGVGLSLGLVAFYYLPIADLVTDMPLHVAKRYREFGAVSVPYVSLLTLVSPALVDGTKIFIDPAMKGLMYRYEVLPFIGIVPILASLLASRSGIRLKRQLAAVTACSALLVGLKLVGLEPLHSLSRIEGFSQIRWVPYAGYVFSFFAAILGALGIECLATGRVSRTSAWLVTALGICGLLGLAEVARSHGVLSHAHADQWRAEWWGGLTVALIFSALVVAASASRPGEGDISKPASSFLFPGGLASNRRRLLASISIILATGVWSMESWLHLHYPRQARLDVWQRSVPAYVKKIRQEAGRGRVFGPEWVFPPNASSAFEIFDLRSMMAFNSYRLHRLFETYGKPWKRDIFLVGSQAVLPDGVLDAADVELILVRAGAKELIRDIEARGYEQRIKAPGLKAYRRQSSPRYYFSSDYRVMDAEAALEALGSATVGKQILLEQAPSFAGRPNQESDPVVTVDELRRNRYRLSLVAPRPGLVYAAESFFRGWSATVNGDPATILRANYAFRAVEVPAGRVTIELSYLPPGLRSGVLVTALSLMATLGLLVWEPLASGLPWRARGVSS